MDSRINVGVPISATQAAPNVPFATSPGIRAPLTIDDDDFKYPASSGGEKGSFFGSFSSDNGFESDEFETASGSDRPFLADIDDEIVEEIHFAKEYVASRPIVINQRDDNFAESSSDRDFEHNVVGEGVVSKPIEGNHCDELFDESSNIGKLRISRELLLYSNKELVENNDSSEEFSECGSFVVDTEEDVVGISYEVDDNVSLDNDNDLMMQQSIPIAQVCWGSEDDFLGDEVSSDGSVSGAVKVVDFEVTERYENAPKIGVLDIEKVENSAPSEFMAEEDSAFSDSHDGMIVDSTVKAAEHYLSADVVEEASFPLNISASENLGSKQVVQKSDWEVQSHASDVPANTELFNTSITEEADVVEDNFANKTVKVNEGFQELQRNSFPLNISASENLGSKQVVQKSDWEVQSHASDVPSNTKLFNTSITEEAYVVEDNFANKTVKVNEGFQELQRNSFPLNISASENLGSQQVVQKSDWEVQSHASDVPANTELFNTSVTEEEGHSLNNANFGATPTAESLVMEDEYYSGSNLGATPTAVRSESFGRNRCGVDIIQSLVMEEEYYCGSEVSQVGLQNSNVGLTSILGRNDTVLLEHEEDFLKYDETLTQEGSDRASGVVLPEQLLTDTLSSEESVENDLHSVGSQTMLEEEEELEACKDPLGEEISASLPTIPGPTTGVGSNVINVTVKSADGDFGTPKHSFVLAAQPDHPHMLASSELMASKELGNISNMEDNKKLVKLQQLKIIFLRLAFKLNQSFDDTIATKVLDKICLAAGNPSAQSFNIEFAKQTAMLLEAEGAAHLDFSLNVLVIGKSGVGKSATINSLFGEDVATTNPFQPSTTTVKMIKRTVNGVQVRVLDTPGLRSYPGEQSFNHRVLLSIKKRMKKFPPDVVLYVDRLDMQYEDLNDIPLLKAVTCYLGSTIWIKTIVTLTHATSTPPEVLSGSPFSYHFFVTRQSEAVWQLISHAVGGGHAVKPSPVNVSLVENQAVSELSENDNLLLPDGSWREKLLFLCYSLKILSEIDLIIKPKASFDYRKFFGFNNDSATILSSFLQSEVQPNYVTTWDGMNFDSQLLYSPDSDRRSEDENDQPLPFKPLRRSQISKLKEEQRRAYFEEYDYYEKLLQKKQTRDEVTSLELVKKRRVKPDVYMKEYLDQQAENHAALAVPLFPLPFDGKSLAYKYQLSGPPFSHLAGPILDFHDWDNDCGYDDVGQFPRPIFVRLKKDKTGFKDQSLFGLSLTRQEGDLVCGLNMQSQFSVGQSTRVCVHAGVHSKKSCQVSFRINSSDGIPIAILGFLPIAKMIFRRNFVQTSER